MVSFFGFRNGLVVVMMLIGFIGFTQSENSEISRQLDEARDVSRNDPEKALKNAKSLLLKAKKGNQKYEIQKSQLIIGEIYRIRGELYQAEKSVRDAYSAETDSILRPDILRELGVILKQQLRYEEALPLYIEAVECYKKQHKDRDVAKMYNNIGRLHYAMEDYRLALDYYKWALEIHTKLDPSTSVGITYHNIGAVYEAQGKTSAAKVEYLKALAIYKELDDKVLIAYGYNSLGNVETNIAKARQYLEKGMQMRLALGLNKDYIESRLNMGQLELRAGNEDEAITIFRWVFSEASKYDLLQFALIAAEHLSTIYEKRNNLDLAIEFTRASYIIQDSLHVREERVKELGFEYRIKEVSLNDSIADLTRDNQMQALEIKIRDNEIKSRQLRLLFWIVFSSLVLIAAIITIYLLVRQRRINHELNRQKTLIEEKSAENEILVREVHHRVKNNLHSVLGILRLERRRLKEPSAIDALEATEQKVGTIATIHELLYGQDNLSRVELNKYIEGVAIRILEFSPYRNLALEVSGDEVFVEAELALPMGQIIAELVTNSVKYAFGEETAPLIRIHISLLPDSFIIAYMDNGCGMQSDVREDAFGMKLIQSLVRKRGGTVKFPETKGFSAEFRIPFTILIESHE